MAGKGRGSNEEPDLIDRYPTKLVYTRTVISHFTSSSELCDCTRLYHHAVRYILILLNRPPTSSESNDMLCTDDHPSMIKKRDMQ